MNIFNKVTLQSLKKNKTRTIVTIVGIILSAAMICAVTTFASSMQNYALRAAIWSDGSWHGSEKNTNYATFEKVSSSAKIKDAIYLQQIGHAYAEGCKNEFKPYIYVVGASEGAEDILSIHITSGRYPAASNEILLPEHLADNGGVHHRIGEMLTLELGTRELDGFVMNPQSPVYVYQSGEEVHNGESLKIRETRTYEVVGFYSRLSWRVEDMSSPGYTAITVADEKHDPQYQYDVYFTMNKTKDVYDFMEENGYTGDRNTDVLMYQGTSQYSTFTVMLVSLAAIVIGLIMFGSISLIYNAFSISVSERTKQFGLLSSLGATKRQLRKMVLFEALAVASIGIPVGIISGIAGIGITLLLIGNKFAALTGNANVPMRICVSWEAVVIAALVALITVLISAWVPSKRATKVSAVEAIRQNMDVKNDKPVKTSKLTYKLFGLPGLLASKHYKRSKKKYRTTVLSLFMSIVLFVSASSFTDYLMESVGGGLGTNGFDLWYAGGEEDFDGKSADDVLAILKSDKDVQNAVYVEEEYLGGIISDQFLNEGIKDNLLGGASAAPAGFDSDSVDEEYRSIVAYVLFISDNEYRNLLTQYGLNESKFMDPDNPLAVTIDGNTAFDRSQQKYTTTNLLNSDNCEIICTEKSREYWDYDYVGEHEDENGNLLVEFVHYDDPEKKIEVPYEDAFITYTLRSGKTIHEYPYYIDRDTTCHLRMIYPVSAYETVIPDGIRAENAYYKFMMVSSDHAASYENLTNVLNENGLSDEFLYDYAEGVEQRRNTVMIVRVFAYGFIVLISLIAAANVFNTISTNISLRRREFAMLKSVGMDSKGFNRMMNFECVLYGSKALLLGLPVSCGVTYLIYLAIMEGYETTFHLPWRAIGIAVLSVFLVVFITMMYSMSKIKKDNPIDALKNENL